MTTRFLQSTAPLFLLFLLLFGCEGPKEPTFQSVEQIKIISLTKEEAVIQAQVVMDNPNPVGIDLTNMSVEVFMDGVKVATTTQTAVSTISPGTFKVPVQVNAPLKDVFKGGNLGTALNMLVNKKVMLKYVGNIEVSLGGVKANIPFEYEEETPLKKTAQ